MKSGSNFEFPITTFFKIITILKSTGEKSFKLLAFFTVQIIFKHHAARMNIIVIFLIIRMKLKQQRTG